MSIKISGRIRLARNISGYPFESKITLKQQNEICQAVKEACKNIDNPLFKDLTFIDMASVDDITAQSLVEAHLISPQFIKNRNGKSLLINKAQNLSIMINEEDHLRIQVLGDASSMDKLLETAMEIDDEFEKHLPFAFDENLGYITHCPTNLGTGMRASVMLHLPCISEAGLLNKLNNIVSSMGLNLRGMYGEGSKGKADFYQLSNRTTMGITEGDTVKRLNEVIKTIEEEEKRVRNELIKKKGIYFENDICTSYGILKYARTISTDEFLKLISKIRLGIEAEIIKEIDLKTLDSLITECHPATIMKAYGELTPSDRDLKRAEIIRTKL